MMSRSQSTPLLFNPSRVSSEELESTFVGRWPLLAELEKAIGDDSTASTPRHWQIIGARGSGKSHLTEILHHRLQADGWRVARLPEEHYQVGSLGGFLKALYERFLQSDLPSDLRRVDERTAEDRIIDSLRALRSASQGKCLAIVENFGMLLDRQLNGRRDQARLRELLTREPPFILVATETSYLDSTTDHAAPFYDFFQTRTLQDLEQADIGQLIEARAKWNKDAQLLSALPTVRRRVDAIYHLSGGNPRLALSLYSVLRDGVTEELGTQLLRLLDEVTPYYQSRLRDVSPQMVRVLAAMAIADRVTTPADLARKLGMQTAQVTAVISRLVGERYVVAGARPDGRRRYYELADRLFRLWIQMREGDSNREQLGFIAEFFQRWYEGSEEELRADIDRVASVFWRELRDGHRSKCSDLLNTLDYLDSAGRSYWAGSFVDILSRSTQTAGIDEGTVEQLKNLAQTTSSAKHRVAANHALGMLFWRAERDGAREYLEKAAYDAEFMGLDVPRSYLVFVDSKDGSEHAVAAGLKLLADRPRLVKINGDLAVYAMRGGDFSLAANCLKKFLECDDCLRCRAQYLTEYAIAGFYHKKYDEILRALEFLDGNPVLAHGEANLIRLAVSVWRTDNRDAGARAAFARALNDIADPSKLDIAVLNFVACVLAHDSQALELAFRYLEAHLRICVTQEATRHLLEVAVRFHAIASTAGMERVVALLREVCNSEPAITDAFQEQMPLLARAGGMRRSVLEVYRRLTSAGLVRKDLAPYSRALAIIDADDREAQLASLHPEEREAVQLLIAPDEQKGDPDVKRPPAQARVRRRSAR